MTAENLDGLSMEIEAMEPKAEDFEPAAPPADPWLARRQHGFGASDVPALLIALRRRSPAGAPKYLAARAEITSRTHGVARIFCEKAGLLAARPAGSAAAKGSARESELLMSWVCLLDRRNFYGPHERLLVPDVSLAREAPREWYPLVDRHCGSLTATPDGWCRDVCGSLVMVEAKCTTRETREPAQHWLDQVQAQIAVCDAASGVIVCGEMWAADWLDVKGPIRSWPVERDERAIAMIREACAEGWEIVTKLREQQEKAA